ncbi:hypothetical protein L218DRAFT_1054048 [Marasmius fiardii PR-910]|nr:hypothetical protein L218DRAFT_1054048 [Marasmius fiardii PR-910]
MSSTKASHFLAVFESHLEQPPVHLVVHNTMGATLIGVVCAAWHRRDTKCDSSLYGVSCVQTWFYFNRYPKDPWYIKLLVLFSLSVVDSFSFASHLNQVFTVWVLDSIHQALISHTVYFYVVTNFTNAAKQADLVWGLSGFLFKRDPNPSFFLAVRVWRFTASPSGFRLTEVVSADPMLDADLGSSSDGRVRLLTGRNPQVCSVVFTAISLQLVTWEDLNHLKGLSNTINVLGVVSDVFIAGGLFYYLHNSRTGFKRSDTIISKLPPVVSKLTVNKIVFSVSTGLLTSICAIASLISNLVWGDTLIYVTFYFCLGRLYSNSLLATLNARKSIRGETKDGDSSSYSLQTFSVPRTRSHKVPRPPTANIAIKIDTTHELVRDTERVDKSEKHGAKTSVADLKSVKMATMGEEV